MPMPVRDLVGQVFGRLSVLSRAPKVGVSKHAYWHCQCACGETTIARGVHLRDGNVTSCGCFHREASSIRNRKPDDQITYNSAHDRVRRARGLAAGYFCVDCDNQAQEWSLSHRASAVRMGMNSNGYLRMFSVDPADYEPRCLKCHRAYDRE
jgi:hypothetical protein